MLKNGRTIQHKCGSYQGCSCHNTKAARRTAKRGIKAREAAAWRREVPQ